MSQDADDDWDPDLDRFLLECVQDQLENSSKINFGLISDEFLEILGEVTPEALARFGPNPLCQRWMDLHNRDLSQEYYYSRAVVAVEASRDRVIDAMQNFLLGLPAYNPLRPPYNPQVPSESDSLETAFWVFEQFPTAETCASLLSLEERVLDDVLLFSQLRLLTPTLLDCEAGRQKLIEAARQRRELWKGRLSGASSE
eukprot:GEMP01062279.1.p1 GENE.GEMP01062279.1~~GEMP01062279.1.p1  ORF type:complete len:199 (+),score=44.17 GEMP01062279.1:208-804(+)